jgi:YHS domain-containing protein
MTKDPVCGMNVDENSAQYQTQYGGKKYSFCSPDCKTKFEKQPEQYARSVA